MKLGESVSLPLIALSSSAEPEGTLEKIRRLEAQIRDIEREIASQTQEIDELRKAFEDDIERLEEVTGEARTLPLDHTKTDN